MTEFYCGQYFKHLKIIKVNYIDDQNAEIFSNLLYYQLLLSTTKLSFSLIFL